MALSLQQMKADFAAIAADMPTSATFNGSTYSAVRKELGAERKFFSYGEGTEYSFSLVFAASDFTTAPKSGDKMAVGGATYRVLKTSLDAAGVTLTVDLGGEYA